MAGVQSYAWPPHHPEGSVQSPLSPTASLAGICLLAIYHRWALAVKGITPQGDRAFISTIKLNSGAAPCALHRHPVSNGYPRASRCPFLSTVWPGNAHWLTQHTDTAIYSVKQDRLVTLTRLEACWRAIQKISHQKKNFWIMTSFYEESASGLWCVLYPLSSRDSWRCNALYRTAVKALCLASVLFYLCLFSAFWIDWGPTLPMQPWTPRAHWALDNASLIPQC